LIDPQDRFSVALTDEKSNQSIHAPASPATNTSLKVRGDSKILTRSPPKTSMDVLQLPQYPLPAKLRVIVCGSSPATGLVTR